MRQDGLPSAADFSKSLTAKKVAAAAAPKKAAAGKGEEDAVVNGANGHH